MSTSSGTHLVHRYMSGTVGAHLAHGYIPGTQDPFVLRSADKDGNHVAP